VASKERQSILSSKPHSWRRLARLFVAGMLCLHLLFFAELRGRIERGYSDFTVFYTAATVLREGRGHQLYDASVQYAAQESFAGHISSRQGPLPYIHPPFEALVFLPLTLLPYRQAFAVWDLLNLVALFAVALLLRRSVRTLRSIPPWEFVVGCLAFFPVFACFLQGQDSILLLLLCVLGFNALKREADFIAGCWFALGTFKFQLIIPIVLLLFIWNRRRVATGFVAVSILLALVSMRMVGFTGSLWYPAYVLQVAKTPALGGVPSALIPSLHGLLTGWPFLASTGVGAVVTGIASLLLVLLVAIRGRAGSHPKSLDLQFSLAVVVAALISWQVNAHDLSLLALPVVLVADYCLRTFSAGEHRRFVPLLPVLPLLISPLWIGLWLAIGQVNLMAIPLLWWTWEMGRALSDGRNFAAKI
jgi:Glycosyltransferase family 87